MVRDRKMFISLVLSESDGFTKSSGPDDDIISHLQQHCTSQVKSMQLLRESEEFSPQNQPLVSISVLSEVRRKFLQGQSGYLCARTCSCTHLLKSGCTPLMLNSAPKNGFLCGNERITLFVFVPLSLTDCFCLSAVTKPHCFGALTGTC